MSFWTRLADIVLLRHNPLSERSRKADRVSQLTVDAEVAKRDAETVLAARKRLVEGRLGSYARVPRHR